MVNLEIVRTPAERFANLSGRPFDPVFRQWRGLRLAHIRGGRVVTANDERVAAVLVREIAETRPGIAADGDVAL